MMFFAHTYIPLIDYAIGRYLAWAVYGYVQGQQMTGIWVPIPIVMSGGASLNILAGHWS